MSDTPVVLEAAMGTHRGEPVLKLDCLGSYPSGLVVNQDDFDLNNVIGGSFRGVIRETWVNMKDGRLHSKLVIRLDGTYTITGFLTRRPAKRYTTPGDKPAANLPTGRQQPKIREFDFGE
jgi:hypothetical protein